VIISIIKLVKKFQDGIQCVHSKDILIVDVNEYNFIVNSSFDEIFFIDCDSYQTPSFPATAIMESIRDRHSKTFSKETDWYSWGILVFQMQIGIHPYKAKHPKYKTLDEKMIHNISVFNKDVSVPAVCYPLTVIPENYRNWYKAIFEDGKRIAPPDTMIAVVPIQTYVKDIIHSNYFDIKKYDIKPFILSKTFSGFSITVLPFPSSNPPPSCLRGGYIPSSVSVEWRCSSSVSGLDAAPPLPLSNLHLT
jgi:hypothetical protein